MGEPMIYSRVKPYLKTWHIIPLTSYTGWSSLSPSPTRTTSCGRKAANYMTITDPTFLPTPLCRQCSRKEK